MANRWLENLTVSEDSSLTLLARAQQGDAIALEALMGRYLQRLQRWASGRLPAHARQLMDTDDLVQDALLNTFRRLDRFQPRHDGALLAYLREAVANRIRNELRRRPQELPGVELDDLAAAGPSALEGIVSRESWTQYERALQELSEDERAAVIARLEMGYSYDAMARAIGRPSADAARKLTERAIRRLVALMAS